VQKTEGLMPARSLKRRINMGKVKSELFQTDDDLKSIKPVSKDKEAEVYLSAQAEGLSYPEIAKLFNTTVGVVASTLHRWRKKHDEN
jgi:Sigma-70, region 4